MRMAITVRVVTSRIDPITEGGMSGLGVSPGELGKVVTAAEDAGCQAVGIGWPTC